MDLSELENVLAGTLSPDQNVRKAAELHLKKVWFFLVILFCVNGFNVQYWEYSI